MVRVTYKFYDKVYTDENPVCYWDDVEITFGYPRCHTTLWMKSISEEAGESE